MQTQHIKILRHMIKQIAKHMTLSEIALPEWRSKTGRHVAAGQFVHDDAPETLFHLGDTWSAGYDDTRWFETTVKIPDGFEGKKAYLKIDFGGEALVSVNGGLLGAVSSSMNSGWVHRDIIHLPALKNGETLHISVEAAVCCGGFCDAALSGATEISYTLATAKIIAIDEAVESYDFDVRAVSEALDFIKDEPTKQRVFAALDDSLHMLDFDFDDAAFRTSVPAAAALLWERLAAIPEAAMGEVLMTGHSHLDVAWLWTVREIVRKTARTFSNNLALLDKYPNFVFTQSQAVLYDFMKRHYPAVYEKVKEKIKGGNWHIVGNAWVEADTNVASGEALIRQLLYGRKFFLEEFGVSSDVYWLPDCFGFTWALPQIIRRSGMKYFLTSKLHGNDTNPFPNTLFRWRAHSGDEVLGYLTPGHYQGDYTPGEVSRAWEKNRQSGIVDCSLGLYGYGDGGGGCTYGMVERGSRLEKIPGLPNTRQGSAEEFFERAGSHSQELPVWNDEMYYENHRGTYSSQAFVKRYNRKGEILFRNAEILSVLASSLSSVPYPAEDLEKGWKLLLINQFHDILPGTSIHDVYVDCRKEYEEMTTIGDSIVSDARAAIQNSIRVEEDSILVWNLLSWPVSKYLPMQNTDGEAIEFFAEDVPAFGYKVVPLGALSAKSNEVTATERGLENSKLRVTLDGEGIITSIFDKENNRETLEGRGNVLTIFQDKPVHESAWNIEINYQKKFWELHPESISVVENTGDKGVLRLIYRFNKSTIEQDIVLYAHADTLEFHTRTNWFETEKMLKASFDVAVRNSFASYEIAHGAINRPTHRNTSYDFAKFEVAAHKWADLSEGGYGVSLLNDCKYGYDIYESTMRITLMRAPNLPDRTADHGFNEFVYSYYPHKNNWQSAKTVQRAFELNNPPLAYFVKRQTGSLPRESAFINISAENVMLDTFKLAEEGGAIVLRVYEAQAKRGEVTISTTLPFTSVTECNMMEVPESAIQTENGGFSFFIKPHEVRTFLLH
ncbi:MAG: glycosyl hydrolase-related protein [Oscillospiraceae bacterium]|nr:glycosyl hydrolase-related protein [Oscillospiraceae bacterium]